MVALLDARAGRFGRWPALRFRWSREAPLRELSWADWREQAQAMANWLLAMGLSPGQRVAIFSRNCPEWLVADMAILMAGGVSVPLPSGGSLWARRRMLHETRPSLVFVGSAADFVRLRESWPGLEDGAGVAVFESHAEGLDGLLSKGATCRVLSFEDALIRGRALMERGDGVRPVDSGRSPEDAATLIYSAGRTGPPRASVLSHHSLVSKTLALRDVVVLPRGAVQLLGLPLDSMFGRLMAWASIDQGATTWIATPRVPLAEQLAEVRPHFLAGVPRTFEQLRDHILTRREGAAGSAGRATLFLADRFLLGDGPEGRRRGNRIGVSRVAKRLFQTRVHHLLGGRIRHLVCGGGAIDASLARVFEVGGLPLLEGYGSNETLGAAAANRIGQHRSGSVGKALSDVEIRVSPSGEVLVRGEGLFSGYLRRVGSGDQLDVDSARDAEGWFHTRDLGMMEDGFLYLTGRQQDILRLTSGRSVAASFIESALVANSRIRHALLCGDHRPYVTVLLWLEPQEATLGEAGSSEAGESGAEPDEDVTLRRVVQGVNQGLERHEQIRAFHCVDRPLSHERGELSSHGEPVRAVIYQRCRDLIETMYAEH